MPPPTPHLSSEPAGSLLPRTRTTLLFFAAYIALASVGATTIAAVHLGHGPAWGVCYAVCLTLLLSAILFRRIPAALPRLLRTWGIWAVLLVSIAAADQLHFQHARTKTNPLTSALALELPSRALLHGREPYSVHLPQNAPISPGPGWLLLLTPLTAPGLAGLLGMAALAITTAVLWRQNPVAAGLFCLLMLVQPLFHSQAANGQDLYVITLAFVALALFLHRHADNLRAVALLGVVAGVLSTARMPLLLVLLVLALGLARRNRRTGVLFTGILIATSAALNGTFALWAQRNGDWFQPMHVFGRGAFEAGHGSQIAVAALSAAALAWILLRMRNSAVDWLFGMWLFMSALFIPEAIKELVLLGYDLRWEGSTYVTFALPLLAAVLVLRSAPPPHHSAA